MTNKRGKVLEFKSGTAPLPDYLAFFLELPKELLNLL
jgi:hypothetical protein